MENHPRSKIRTSISLILIIFAVISVITMTFSYFTDRANSTASIFTSTFDDNGYSITLESETDYRTAGETVEMTLKESNDKTENITSAVSMLVTWDSPVADTYPWGNGSDIEIQMDGDDLTYTVNDNNTLSIALPKHSLSAGASESTRELLFQIPADTEATGNLRFSVESIDLAQDPHGWSASYDNSDLSDLVYDAGVVWNISQNAQNAFSSEINMDVIAFLTKGSGTDKYGLSILKNGSDINTNGGAMRDWTSANQTPWSNYTITSLTLADGVTTIGDHAFDGSGLSGEITIPASIGKIGKLAFANLPNVAIFTFEHDATSSLSLPDYNTEEPSGAFYAGSNFTAAAPLPTKVNTTNKDVLDYAWNKDTRGYTVTVTDVTGVTVNADPATAVNGQPISLDITEDTNYEYKGATVSWTDGSQSLAADETSFTMPAANVTITPSAELSVQHISTVPSQSGSLIYTGSSQTPSWSNFDSSQMSISGTTSAANAGTYTATFTPKDGYAWSDGSTTAKSVSWTISKKSLTVPSQSGSLTYTGSSQSPSWSNYNSSFMTYGGTTSRTNAGSSTATFTLKDTANYEWKDGTVSAKNVSWTINKAAGSLSLSATTLEISNVGATQTITVTRVGDGVITATSSNTGVATVSVSGTTVTVKSVASGSATITVRVAAGTNHNAPSSKTISVTVKADPTAFAIYSSTDNSLIFYNRAVSSVPSSGTYNNRAVTAVYTGWDTETYTQNDIPWYNDGNYASITNVSFCR